MESLGTGATLDEVAVGLMLPIHRVSHMLREAAAAGLIREELGVYRVTAEGADALRRSGAVTPRCEGTD